VVAHMNCELSQFSLHIPSRRSCSVPDPIEVVAGSFLWCRVVIKQLLQAAEPASKLAPTVRSLPMGVTELQSARNSLTYRSGKRSVLENGAQAGEGPPALQFLMDLAADLARGPVDLPCFPNVVLRIRDALRDPKTSTDDALKLVGAEPRLAARLIQTANSVAFNPAGTPVTELRTAITRLGYKLVEGAAIAFAVQQMRDEPRLRSISKELTALWNKSLGVASISQVVARRTKIRPEEAFLTGLLHGIGHLYIMARAVGEPGPLRLDRECANTIADWHPSIGKAVLENWRVGEAMAESVGDQLDYDRKSRREPDLTDILIVSVALAETLGQTPRKAVEIGEISAFQHMSFTQEDCIATLKHAEYQLGSLHDALGC
jgi:HD-like signal output (HDOD) protein